MSLYDRIKTYVEQGKTAQEIAEIPRLNENPRLVPLADLNELLLASGAWSVLTTVAASGGPAAGLAGLTLGLFQGKLNNFDARKYRDLIDGVLAILNGNVPDEAIAQVKELCGVGQPNPTVEEIQAAIAEGEAEAAKATVRTWLAGKYNAAADLADQGKSIDELKAFLVA